MPQQKPFETVRDLDTQAEVIRRRRYGVIEVSGRSLSAVHFRPWPKRVSLLGAWWDRFWIHGRADADRCWLYFNHPLGSPEYLSLNYFVSGGGAGFSTVHNALSVLDRIARIKGVRAIVCQVSNQRISTRALERWGWTRHLADSRQRHFIKRLD